MSYFQPIVWQLLGGTVFARIASFMTLPFLAIYLQNELHASPLMIGLVVGISQLAATIGGFFGGFLTDRFGRKPILKISVFCWSAVFFAFAFAESIWVFLLCSALNGLCRSFFEPASQALMIDYTDERKRRRLFSIRYTAINLSAVVGPLIGVLLIQSASMHIPFLITASMYFMYGLFMLWILRNVPEVHTPHAKSSLKAMSSTLIHDTTLLLLLVAAIFGSFVYAQTSSTMPQLLTTTFADGLQLYSILIAVNSLTVLILQLPLGILSERVSVRTSIVIGVLLFVAGMLGFHLATNWTLYIVAMVIFSIGEIFVFPMMSAVIEMIAPPHQKATYLGMMQFQSLGGFLGPFLGSWLLVHFANELYVFMAGISLLSLVCYFFAFQKKAIHF